MKLFLIILSSWAAISIGAENPCSCYTFHTIGKDWPSNNNYCQQYGGNLVSMETEEEYQFINKTIQSRNDGDNEWHIGLIRRTREWKWLSNHSLTFDKWQPHQPNNDGPCVVMAKNYPPGHYGLFKDDRCDIHKMFICEYKTEGCNGTYINKWCSANTDSQVTSTSTSTTGNLCPCYTFHTSMKDWVSSNNYCQQNGGNLVTMETEEEYQFINKTVQSRNDGDNEWYIGLKKRTREWKWLSNHSLTMIDKWQPHEPNNDGPCVVMAKNWPKGHYGLFRDVRCDIHKMFICEYKTVD